MKQVALEQLQRIEKMTLKAADYGGEVMGIVRPPLFRTNKGGGFSDFIQNKLVGNSLIQLLRAIHHFGILSAKEIIDLVENVK